MHRTRRALLLIAATLTVACWAGHLLADMAADSPVTFPKKGCLPSKYPPDVRPEGSKPTEKDYAFFGTPCRSLAQIANIQAAMPPGKFTPPKNDWKYLSRTHRILTEGGNLRLIAFGDSIVNDTMRSGWVAKLQEAYPKAKIRASVYVRGGGGCQHYREENRVEKFIIPEKPDLVFIGGISQRSVEDIRDGDPQAARGAAERGDPAGHRRVRHGRPPRAGRAGQGPPLRHRRVRPQAQGPGRRAEVRVPRHDRPLGRVHPLDQANTPTSSTATASTPTPRASRSSRRS